MTSLRIDNISFAYFDEGKNIIDGLSMEVERSDITVLTGASGCGKSTLLYLAAGIYPGETGFLRGGSVSVEGEDPAGLTADKRCRRVGVMFQNPELQFCMDTVRNELIFCMENTRMEPSDMDRAMDDALDFCEIGHLKERALRTLSGGEKQKVMLACMVLLDPKWMLLDEPFANVDGSAAKSIAEKLARLHRERGTGILVVDHRLEHWMDIADRILVMKDSRIVKSIALEGSGVTESEAEELRQLGVSVPGYRYGPELPPREPGDTAVELRDLSVSIDKKTIISGVSATFKQGMSYAILGESGCGKSTLFGALSGMYRYGGSALLYGKEFRGLKAAEAGVVGFVTQNPQDQFVGGTVKQEILTSLRHSEDAESRCEEILRGISLWRYRDISPYMLSQGQQRRLGVAALMAYPCRVLICDEPTYAQDLKNTMAIMDTLYERTAEKGATLIFSTHDRQLAREYADVIYGMREGGLYEIV